MSRFDFIDFVMQLFFLSVSHSKSIYILTPNWSNTVAWSVPPPPCRLPGYLCYSICPEDGFNTRNARIWYTLYLKQPMGTISLLLECTDLQGTMLN